MLSILLHAIAALFGAAFILRHESRVAADQWLNTIVWAEGEGFGKPDETLSARAFRLGAQRPATWGRFECAVNLLFFWEKDEHGERAHCFLSFLAEKERKHLPPRYRHA